MNAMNIKNERVRALRRVAKFLEYCSRGAQPTREEFKTIANLCWINVPMKYRMDKAEIEELDGEVIQDIRRRLMQAAQ